MKRLIYTFIILCFATVIGLGADSNKIKEVSVEVADSTSLAEYVGKYKFVGLPFEYLEISLKEGVLYVDAGGQGGPLTRDKDVKDKFDVLGEAILKFIRNEDNKIVKIEVDYQGMVLSGEKENE